MATTDETIIKLQARLDILKSVKNINSDMVNQLQKKIDSLKLQPELNPKAVSKLYKEIQQIAGQNLTLSNIHLDETQLAQSKQLVQETMNGSQPLSVGDYRRVDLLHTLNNYLADNTAISTKNKQAVKDWMALLSSPDDMALGTFKQIHTDFKKLDTALKKTGETGLSTQDKLKQLWKHLGSLSLVPNGLDLLTDSIKRIPDEVYKIDTAMSKLKNTAHESQSEYNGFLDTAGAYAQELGIPLDSIVDQTTSWAKQGYSLEDAAELAKTSSLYANIAGMDGDKAMSGLQAAVQAFNLEARDSIQVVDQLNKLEQEFTISSADLGDGLSKSASAMALGGNSLKQTLALLAGGSEITQNADSIASALQTGQLRVMGMKDSLQQLGEEYETVASADQIQNQILQLTNGQVSIMDQSDPGQFREYYQILKDIAEIYHSFGTSSQEELLEILFGSRYETQGAALIQAFESGQVQKALEAASNAQGSAMQKQELLLDSLEAKTQQFETAFQSLASTILDSDLLKGLVDFGTDGLQLLDSLIEGFQYLASLGGLLDSSLGGTLGAVSGLLMNQAGIGERTVFQW